MKMISEHAASGDKSYKIFGIGLPRTGTTSLSTALNEAGIPTLHGAYGMFPGPVDMSHPIYQKFSGFVDTPFYLLFEKANLRFPDCKFIFTTRRLDRWLESCANLWKVMNAIFPPDHAAWIYIAITFGSHSFNANRLTTVFHRHHDAVERFFASLDTARYLTIDLDETERPWSPLAKFLGITEPNSPYPHSNTTEDLLKIASGAEMKLSLGKSDLFRSESLSVREFEFWTVRHSPVYKVLGHLIVSSRDHALRMKVISDSSCLELGFVLNWSCSALQELTASNAIVILGTFKQSTNLHFHILPRVRFLSDEDLRVVPEPEDDSCEIHPQVLARFLRHLREFR